MMGSYAGIVFGLIVGMALAVQGAMNARLGDSLGGAVPAAVISFLVGLTALMAVTLLTRQPPPTAAGLQAAPWWSLLGGFAGAAVVAGAAFFIPKIGVSTWLAVIIAGQLLAAIAIDHFGALDTEVRQINLTRIGGVALLGLGVWLVQKGGQAPS